MLMNFVTVQIKQENSRQLRAKNKKVNEIEIHFDVSDVSIYLSISTTQKKLKNSGTKFIIC